MQDIFLFVPSQVLNAFGDVASLYGLEGLQDFIVFSPELQRFLSDRLQYRMLTSAIDVLP